ncbi:hypothetical protein EYF80_019461 [Liparis tanakae]|uniref:Uncharacterized protein n=1 Tax=Liparis tanakae TaxID=230148 RepID=A0A4Z2HX28_9TELE|nr:hypothetical protein EYF80_019461 [Liparis tanakae]
MSATVASGASSDERRLHQLREEDILVDQHKLSVAVAVTPAVARHAHAHAHVHVLHHAVDWDHQTWQTERERERES